MTKKRMKKILLLLVLIILLSGIINKIYAADSSCTLSLTTNNTELKRGDTVTLTLKVTKISMEDNQNIIVGSQGNITYDAKVFENVKVSSKKLGETSFNNGIFIANSSDMLTGITEGEELLTIELKVKDNATIGESNIKIDNMIVSNINTIAIKNLSSELKLKIAEDNKEQGGNKTENTTSGGQNVNQATNQNNTQLASNSNKQQTVNQSKTTSNSTKGQTTNSNNPSTTSLPKTGTSFLMVGVIIGAIGLAVFFYIKYTRAYEEK